MNKTNDIIPDYQAESAIEFWEFLSPLRYILWPGERLIFRGQADSTWHLEPSILRGKNHPVYSQPLMKSDPSNSDYQIIAEVGALKTFTDHCDSSGLQIPGITTRFKREHLDQPNAIFSKTTLSRESPWPLEEYFDLMSMAQHFGLPTRLLDWTRDPYVAAFFAASELALKPETANKLRLAVWALDIQELPKQVELIRVPSSGNQNIAAQRGVFTLLRQPYRMGKGFEGTHLLDQHVRNLVTVHGKQRLIKITLPQSECFKIMDLCSKHSVTAATLHPDFYGAAKATQIDLAVTSKCTISDGSDVKIKKQSALKTGRRK
ncbi:FRG domain-containing protein [Terracidiphilus gabretensis]|uniref:FRG domain-containing protein n=1 Tax=Terracidiphilus gabretensis TaxID=1577687 RepID=UPI00071C0CCE|nr:FRG domain-containing protein [Terracidiphilus gabretensis]